MLLDPWNTIARAVRARTGQLGESQRQVTSWCVPVGVTSWCVPVGGTWQEQAGRLSLEMLGRQNQQGLLPKTRVEKAGSGADFHLRVFAQAGQGRSF